MGDFFQGARPRAQGPPPRIIPPPPPRVGQGAVRPGPAGVPESVPDKIVLPAGREADSGVAARPSAPVVRVALLLPLSGNNAALGRALLDAAQLALFDIGDQGLVLLPRDTGGTSEGAGSAAEAVLSAGATLILGPLFAAEAGAVTRRARARGVPVISFSNDRAVTQVGAYMFGIAPQSQVERILGYARSRGLSRYAALLPNNLFGATVEETMRATIPRLGAELVAIERYDPTASDVSPVVRRLVGAEVARRAVAREPRRGGGTSPVVQATSDAEVAFDAVFLPDAAERVLNTAPVLSYYDVDPARVRYLGTALWDDPRVGREPALVGAWFTAPPPENRSDFARRYRETYGRDPPRLATLAYDAVALAAVLARGPRGADFSDRALTSPSGFEGLDGIFRLRQDGMIERGLAVLEVRREGFRTLSPAPTTFQELTR